MSEESIDQGKTFFLAHETARRLAAEFILHKAPDGWKVRCEEPKKRRAQEEKYHAQIGDIAKQTTYAGRTWKALHMKRILIDEFAEEMRAQKTPLHEDSVLVPSENGRRVIQLEIHSSDFYISEASLFIEFLNHWGAERGVVWSDESRREIVKASRERVAA